MSKQGKYEGFEALDPFFAIIQNGLTGLVDGEHFFDTFAEDAVFESLYHLPGWPRTIRGRSGLVDALSGYGDNIKLHSSDGLVVHRSQVPRVVILEYEVHGKVLATGVPYDNRLIGHGARRDGGDREDYREPIKRTNRRQAPDVQRRHRYSPKRYADSTTSWSMIFSENRKSTFPDHASEKPHLHRLN